MPVHQFEPPSGRIETLSIESSALQGNLLGDPSRRTVAVYLPPDYEKFISYPLRASAPPTISISSAVIPA